MKSFIEFLKESEQKSKVIAVVSGSFKPPHKAHWYMIQEYAKIADEVYVLISDPIKGIRKTKIGTVITPEIAKEIFETYKDAYKLSNVNIEVSKSPSPVTAAYDFVKNEAPQGSTIYFGASDKDNDYMRWNPAQRYFFQHRPDLKIIDPKEAAVKAYISNDGVPVSASALRNNIDNEEFVKSMLPDKLNDIQKNYIISLLKK